MSRSIKASWIAPCAAAVLAINSWPFGSIAQGQPIERSQQQFGNTTPWLSQYPSDKLPAIGKGTFKVKIDGDPKPLVNGKLQHIVVSVATSNNQPVSGARISVSGRARDVRRFLPTTPSVTREVATGKYLVEGLRFNMAGSWLLEFEVEKGKEKDRTLLELQIN